MSEGSENQSRSFVALIAVTVVAEYAGWVVDQRAVGDTHVYLISAVVTAAAICFNALWIWSFYIKAAHSLLQTLRRLAFGVIFGTLPLLVIVAITGRGVTLTPLRLIALVAPSLIVTAHQAVRSFGRNNV